MSTFNLNIEDCNKNQFPIELIFTGNQIYNGVVSLAKTTAGIIILIPISIAMIVVLPITYILISLILTYYLIRLSFLTSQVLKIVVSKDNYTDLYNLYLFSNKSISDLTKIESKSKERAKGIFIKPILFFIKKSHSQVLRINHNLESQLFEKHNPIEVPSEDVEFFRAQLKVSDDDWNDNELWKDFQIKHHHLAN